MVAWKQQAARLLVPAVEIPPSAPQTDKPKLPDAWMSSMTTETTHLAQIIATAADKTLGVRPDGHPKPQDNAAAEAIAAEYVLIRRDELPSVRRWMVDPNTYYTDGTNVVFTSVENARTWVMRDVAVWQFIEAEGKEAIAARDERRDELAKELGETLEAEYQHCSAISKRAIDRIIELESGA